MQTLQHKVRLMNRNQYAKRLLPVVIALTLTASGNPLMAQTKDSITIYSSAQPGSISPDTYRPVPGQHQGYYNVNCLLLNTSLRFIVFFSFC